MYFTGGLFVITAVMNMSSMPEKTLSEIERSDEIRSKTKIVDIFLNIPPSLAKLALSSFLSMYINIILYVWFTHQYAETVYHASKEFIAENLSLA